MATFYDLSRSKTEFRGYDIDELNWEYNEFYEDRSGGYNTDGLSWEYNEFCENRGGSRDWMDPVDLLPVDPFGMGLGSNLAAAIAGWIDDLNALENVVSIAGFYDCELKNCNKSHGEASNSCDLFDYTIADDLIGKASSSSDSFDYTIADDLIGKASSSCDSFDYTIADDLIGKASSCDSFDYTIADDLIGKASSSCDSFDYTIADDLIGGEEDNKTNVLHEGLMLSLNYLGVKDLLSVDGVCKSLHFAVQNEWWLWRCMHIDSPLNGKVDDGALERLCSRAHGRLQCLSLNECPRVTDDGLRNVLESNPMLEKLSISGCTKLSIEGLISSLKAFKTSSITGIQSLKVGKQFWISPENYEALQLLVGGSGTKTEKSHTPRFYHIGESSTACDNIDGCTFDIELCSGCQKYKLIFDCPSENCQGRKEQCRACEQCIERCVKCGRCFKDCRFVETFFMDNICFDCWKTNMLMS